MIEAIQVIRDVVIILAFVVITSVVVMVGMALLRVARKVENAGKVAAAAVNGVVHPVKGMRGLLLAFSRGGKR